MNDFTKDELYVIDNALKHCSSRDCDITREDWVKAWSKIQSMIDSYCEHEFYCVGCDNNMFAQCHKCGEIKRLIRNDNQQ